MTLEIDVDTFRYPKDVSPIRYGDEMYAQRYDRIVNLATSVSVIITMTTGITDNTHTSTNTDRN